MKSKNLFLVLSLLFSVLAGTTRAQTTIFGNALSFNGANQYVSVTNFGSIAPSKDVTVEFWANANALAQQSAFMLEPDIPTNRFNAHISYNNGNTYWDFGNITTTGREFATNPPNTIGNWVHYALVASKSGNNMLIYANGNLIATNTGMTPFVHGSYELRIGGNNSYFFNGQLDEFRVWNTALSQAQIQANMNASLAGNEPGLVLYYRFDSSTGAVAVNSATATGSAYNGTLVNSPSWVNSTAGPRVVFSTADSGPGSLRQTIGLVNAGGAVLFDPSLAGRTIVLITALTIGTNLTIDASALAGGINLNGNGHARIFQVNTGVTAVLNSLVITNAGMSGQDGGAILNAGDLTANNCTFWGNTAFGANGGAIMNQGNLSINGCTFASNSAGTSATLMGGAIANANSLTVINSTFTGNSAGRGGAISSATPGGGGGGAPGTLRISACTISGNTVSPGATSGGIYMSGTIARSLTNSIVSGNFAGNVPADIDGNFANVGAFNLIGVGGGLTDGVNGNQVGSTDPMLAPLGNYGGAMPTMLPLAGSPAIAAGGPSSFPLDQRGLPRNAPIDIGAVAFQKSTVVSNISDFSEYSLRAAAYYSPDGSTVTFDPALSGQNFLTTGGIGISNSITIDASALPNGFIIEGYDNVHNRIFTVPAGVTAVLNSLSIFGGSSTSQGGAIWNKGNLTVNGCTFAFNSAATTGGAIDTRNFLAVNNCTFIGNSAPFGGAISSEMTGRTLIVCASTITRNSTTSTNVKSGGIAISASKVFLTNSIVSGNFAGGVPTGVPGDIDGNPVFGGAFNLIGVIGLGGGLTNGINGNQVGVTDPGLTSLALFGGPTPTMAPVLGSPAIDAGVATSLTTDQRGFPRSLGLAPDIGAVEGTYFIPSVGPLTGMTRLGDGSARFTFTNYTDAIYTVLASTNLTLPISTWSNVGTAVESPAGSGQFQFTDSQATNYPGRFYRVSAP